MLIFGPSSVIHTGNGNGDPTVAEYCSAMPAGGPVNRGPSGLNRIIGGVFLFAASSNGSTM